jgi:glycosyltransferase involved in cell wall biosynthesis
MTPAEGGSTVQDRCGAVRTPCRRREDSVKTGHETIPKTVLFFRNFKGTTGGDLKVWHYFNHVLASAGHRPLIRFSDDSIWDDSNPWRGLDDHIVGPEQDLEQLEPDVLFLSGIDWRNLSAERRKRSPAPIFNLIQGLRAHTVPSAAGYEFVTERAIRISVGAELTEALEADGRVNGPLVTIPNAIDFDEVAGAARHTERDTDLLIVATKTRPYPFVPGVLDWPPELGRRLLPRLERPGRRIHLIDEQVPRPEYLDWMSRSKVTLFLLYRVEACPLSPLEGMALGTVVVSPDCVGNRSFCLPGVNSFRPDYEDDAIVASVEQALRDYDSLGEMVEQGIRTARERDLPGERTAFLELLDRADELWRP